MSLAVRTDPADAAAIEASLVIAAERGGDLTPSVYGRLFERQPQIKALFWRDADNAVKGEMLSKVFEAILDFIADRRYADQMVRNEVVTHEGYDVPRDVFPTFFGIVADVVRETCGQDWTAEMAAAWRRMLDDLDAYVAPHEQAQA